MIRGEGPVPCELMLIGEQPGVEEVKYGRVFIGRAGGELQRFLNGYELPRRQDVFLTNLKRVQAEKRSFTVEQWEHDALWDEILAVQPRVIVTLGAHITQYFLGDGATMEMVHGLPHSSTHIGLSRLASKPWIFPAYNPAAALHSPTLQSTFAYDMRRLSLALKGQLDPPTIDNLGRDYRLLDGDAIPYFRGEWAMDTEGLPRKPWCSSFSARPGTGFVVKAAQMPIVVERMKAEPPTSITFHNSLHDLGVCRDMDLDLDELGIPFDDTMIMAYLLGLEPQGLKPLGYRHAGATHDDYSDIVELPSQAICEQWMVALYDRLPEYIKPEKIKHPRRKKGDPPREPDPPVRKPTALEHARKLVGNMIAKNDPATLRTRWGACRAREILVDEEYYLVGEATDPPEASLDEVPEKIAVDYASRDADLTGRVKRSLRPQITAMGLDDAYAADIAIVPMVDRMQAVGLDTDVEHFKALSQLFRVEESINAEEIRRVCGRDINPNSGDQVAEFLFDELRIQDSYPNLRLKRTEGGERFSTNDKVLEAIEGGHPSVALFQEGREIRKMYGTYADVIPWLVWKDGRLHPRYRITRTDTGRLSAADPNVLALPKHSKRGKLIRQGFRAGPGRVLGEWDLDQIEMRTFACDAMDSVMMGAFLAGRDLHAETGALLNDRAYADLYAAYKRFKAGDESCEWADEERFAAKAVNFGILMGITPYGLLDQFHKAGQSQWTLDMTDDLLRKWHATYPEGSRYIDRKHAEARRYGYVRDRFGRLRWLEGIHSYDKYIRSEAERMAQATPTQSGAQGIMKRIMAVLWPMLVAYRKMGVWVECLLQVHDALVLEYDPRYEGELDAAVHLAVASAVTMPIPITAKGKLSVARLSDL